MPGPSFNVPVSSRSISRSTAEKRRRKRDARRRTVVRRGELLTATPPVDLNRAFLRRLKAQDPKLELHWHPLLDRFLLYTRIVGNGQPDDLLVYEWDMDGERPGLWLLDWLKWADKFANGAKSPRRARREYLQGLEDHENARLKYWDDQRMQMSEEVAKHLSWCIDGRCSVTSDWGKRRYMK